jgi:antitoxin component of MazEF toxin-antitoxin module
MRSQVSIWGNSAALRLPRELLAKAGIALDHPVNIEARDGEIVISAIVDPAYSLSALLAASPPRKFALDDSDRIWLADEPE